MGGKDKGCAVFPRRTAGVLMHISSLPGPYGIGTMGEQARRFADFLRGAGFAYWQVLPLVQTGHGDSPYQSVYASSGNPYLIDPDALAAEGLLKKSELAAFRRPNAGQADYGFLRQNHAALLRRAYARFDRSGPAFRAFAADGGMEDYALFMALREKYGAGFFRWPKPLRRRDPAALAAFRGECAEEIGFWLFVQFTFFKQWRALKEYVNGLGIRIVGDIPLYMAYDSADVWANPHLFKLNKDLTRRKVAGVPPDYFSATGQLWGNPVYDWPRHKAEGYAWWIDRIRRAFDLYDVVRIDHFRGFDRYFEIDAHEDTAMHGQWKKGPGAALFDAARAALGELSFIAEDLGTLDEGVYRLLRRTGYPGMKVIQFAFDGSPQNPYLPANIGVNAVCYTGTHDNDTLVGFLSAMQDWERNNLHAILRPLLRAAGIPARLGSDRQTAAALRALALSTRAQLCVLPVQDILLLGGDARMNVPSVPEGNWRFRLTRAMPRSAAEACRSLLQKWGRTGGRA